MFGNDKKNDDVERERLFQQRIADLGFKRQQLPWAVTEIPKFNLPQEETKLFAERELEDQSLSEEEVERRVLLDLLSQTYNFRTFYKRLHYELKRARRYQRMLTVCLVGIDGLPTIAKQSGSDMTDALIQSTARIVLNCIRDVDLAGRCREDTFGLILPETGLEGAEVAAERIRTKLERNTVTVGWQSVSMTASLGVACFPGPAESVDELFAQAAEAMLAGMQRGGNGVVFATPRK